MDSRQVAKVQQLVQEKPLKSPQNLEEPVRIKLKEVNLIMLATLILEETLNSSTSLRTQFLLKICKINRISMPLNNKTNHMHIKAKWLDLLIRPIKKTLTC